MRAGIVVLGFGISLLALGALADMAIGVPAAEAQTRRPTLRLVWVDVRGVGALIHAEAAGEATTILNSAGLDVVWHSSDGSQRAMRDDEIQVVLLGSNGRAMPADVMGTAYPGARGARTVWVFLSGIRRALGYDPGPRANLRPAELMSVGRAVGRVIVHEIVHLTAPDRPHAEAGLMAPRLGRGMLTKPRLLLEPGLRDVLCAAANIGAPAEPGAGIRTVLAEDGGDPE
jgi:hypothetical protein